MGSIWLVLEEGTWTFPVKVHSLVAILQDEQVPDTHRLPGLA